VGAAGSSVIAAAFVLLAGLAWAGGPYWQALAADA
jgi:branched-chain amino acid transport system permease protein